jgi:hypothetical protein
MTRNDFVKLVRDKKLPSPWHRTAHQKVQDFIYIVGLAGAVAHKITECPEEIRRAVDRGVRAGIQPWHFEFGYPIAQLITSHGTLYVGARAKDEPNYEAWLYVDGELSESYYPTTRTFLIRKVSEILDFPIREKSR